MAGPLTALVDRPPTSRSPLQCEEPYIEPGVPWQKAYVESFNGKLRDELVNLESFDGLFEAQVLIEDWHQEYNHYRPHQSLRYLTPAEFARRWRAEHPTDTS
jgi:putative transposase